MDLIKTIIFIILAIYFIKILYTFIKATSFMNIDEALKCEYIYMQSTQNSFIKSLNEEIEFNKRLEGQILGTSFRIYFRGGFYRDFVALKGYVQENKVYYSETALFPKWSRTEQLELIDIVKRIAVVSHADEVDQSD